jgi:hypothetical protein
MPFAGQPGLKMFMAAYKPLMASRSPLIIALLELA